MTTLRWALPPHFRCIHPYNPQSQRMIRRSVPASVQERSDARISSPDPPSVSPSDALTFPAFTVSCTSISKRNPMTQFRPTIRLVMYCSEFKCFRMAANQIERSSPLMSIITLLSDSSASVPIFPTTVALMRIFSNNLFYDIHRKFQRFFINDFSVGFSFSEGSAAAYGTEIVGFSIMTSGFQPF